MKKNSQADELVTRPILQQELTKEFASFEDRYGKKMDEKFASFEKRQDEKLDIRTSEIMMEFAKLDMKFEALREEVNALKDFVMTAFDKIMKKLDDLTTDNTVGTEQIHTLRITSDDHEKRILKLEHPGTS